MSDLVLFVILSDNKKTDRNARQIWLVEIWFCELIEVIIICIHFDFSER